MTRPFYTDPLAAAWMERHHGMQFFWNDHTGQADGDLPLDFEDIIEEITNGFIQRFYIHPDSLHLLEPQVGDVITYTPLYGKRVDFIHSKQDQPDGRIRLSGCVAIDVTEARIIQRNGLPFHWPESEAVCSGA